jgi:cytochrome c553/cytochrome c5
VKRRLPGAGLLLLSLGFAGALLSASGLVPIEASSGHWKVTELFLQFSKRRSISTHTLGADPPALNEPWLVLKGAGHYETGCRPCHGSPGFEHPRIARAMTPRPPYLGPRVATYESEELFYIVKHGIKFTGMPAWPSAQRDDEVRAVVAFLSVLPRLDRDQYRRLVHGDAPTDEPGAALTALEPQAPPAVAASCARCHGNDGQGRGSAAFPSLAGQSREYLQRALDAFARDRRQSGIMQPVAAGLGPEERFALAEYYSRLGPMIQRCAESPGDADELERGRRIALDGAPDQGVPSCVDCHGPGQHRRNPAYPLLAGQYADYLVLQLELFQRGNRGGSAYAHLMGRVAARLNPAQMRDVARYYACASSLDHP